MPDLLLELFSEEIPARMQARAAADLERAVNKRLIDAGFMPEGVKGFATPRRLTVVATGLPASQPDRREEKKGPRVGAPEKAVEGFLKSAGLSSLDECEQREDKKGAYYVAVLDQKGGETAALIAEFVPEIVRGFSWPKSMRWGDGELKWVRPLHRILCAFDGEVVDFEIGNVKSDDKTEGHRFMAPDIIQTRNYDDYSSKLRAAKVLLDMGERKEIIARDAETLCKAQGFELVEDEGLLNEVSGLAEWPVVMMGSFDEKFLTIPDEVLIASMRGHQKYFSVKDPKTGRLANKFVCVANIEAPDGGAAMREGYERVLEARLSDGWFLYNQDLKTKLEDRIEDLNRVTFFDRLKSVGDKARRVAALAKVIAPDVGADPDLAFKAAMLAKADLVSGMVIEFPELQGVMGRYYALEEGESAEVADAIRDHYKPAGQGDDVPTAPVSVAVALADKIDTLTAFWAIDQKPTGSKDPFALRRAALGVIGLVLHEKTLLEQRRLSLVDLVDFVFVQLADQGAVLASPLRKISEKRKRLSPDERMKSSWRVRATDVLRFFHDRLQVYLKDKGHRHDHVEAILNRWDGTFEDDLVLIVAKLEALEIFLKADDGANLVAAYKRAANILKAEEKKDKIAADPAAVKKDLLADKEEKALFTALEKAEANADKAVADENFEAAMSALASLRSPLDAFFEKVTVNADDKALRANRLSLLARFRAAAAKVADFSKLEG